MVRFVVVGCGFIGGRYVNLISQNTEAQLVALCDADPIASQRFNLKNCPVFPTIEDLLSSDVQFDVAVICTPNGLHAEHALAFLESNHHVVVEKPFTLTTEDALRVIQKSQEVNRHVFCVMQNRFSPVSQWLHDIVSNNLLGNIYMVDVNCYWNRDERYYTKQSWHGTKNLDGGTLFTQFSHYIDLICWLFGDVANVQSRLLNFSHQNMIEFEDSGVVNFDLKNGGVGTFSYSTSVWNSTLESSMLLLGEFGSVKISGQYMDEIAYCSIKDYNVPENMRQYWVGNEKQQENKFCNHKCLIQNVIDVIMRKSAVAIKPSEAVQVVDVIEKIYKNRVL
ncbi:MAG: Gfo/Idh/MocA family oxidoreductase [Bacteroidales bacterium]|nr:Gfo/Idh/MocA family oxidoreductase [Bacteroidales bacterium]